MFAIFVVKSVDNMINNIQTEKHPLKPFLPLNATVLMLGSFPPKRERWSMEFFYPNWINDMWRIMGLLFFGDKHYFEVKGEKRFDKNLIEEFCISKGLALYDTAYEVKRLKDNASDKFLEVITPTDISELLKQLPNCSSIVVTGQKAIEIICQTFNCIAPEIGNYTNIRIASKEYRFWRMPSSSRAYPMSVENKAVYYKSIFEPLF